MTFVTTGFLIAGLLAVAVPIIIHLLSRQRKKPIEWAAMRFLLEAFRKQKRRLQIEQLILLALRCLILALLGAALARPILNAAGVLQAAGDRVVFLVLDDGLASGVVNADGTTALREQVERAKTIVAALGASESVGLITASRPVTARVVPPTLDHGAVLRLLDELEPTTSPTDLPAALRTLEEASTEATESGRAVVSYLLSDFRAGSAALDVPLASLFPPSDRVTLLFAPPASEPAANVHVVGVEPVRRVVLPGATDGSRQIAVRLARFGGELDRSVSRVRLSGDGIAVPEPKTVEWSPGQSSATAVFVVDFKATRDLAAGLTATVEPAGGTDALAADNRAHVVVEVRDRVRIAMVSPPTFGRAGLIETLTPGQWIRRALAPGERGAMEIVDVDPSSLDEVDLRSVDVAFITRPDRLGDDGWRVLSGFVRRGGLAFFTPPAELNVHPWTDRLRTELELPWRINLEVVDHQAGLMLADEQPSSELLRLLANELGPLTRSIRVHRVLPIDAAATQARRVLEFADGSPMMIMGSPDDADAAQDEDGATSDSAAADDAGPRARGIVVFLAVAPELTQWSNMPAQPFMVPLFQESVRQGLNLVRENQRLQVGDRPALLAATGSATDLVAPDASRLALDRQQRPTTALRQSGLYTMVDAADQSLGRVAVNINPASARTESQSEAAVTAWLSDSGAWSTFNRDDPAAALATVESGSPIALFLLIAIVALALLETLLARWFSHAYRTGPAVAGATSGGSAAATMFGGLRPTLEERKAAAGGRL